MGIPNNPGDLSRTEPSIKLGSLEIWVYGREFEESLDYWDGNWLNVTAKCTAPGATVIVQGSILTAMEILQWKHDCERMLAGDAESSILEPMEPDLRVALEKIGSLGHIELSVSITPEVNLQSHDFTFQLDESYLPGLIEQCGRVLRSYPVRNNPGT